MEVVKQFKGRPRKVEGEDGVTIKDPLLGKYHIKITEDQYELLQTSTVSKDKTMGYFATLSGALSKVAKLQMQTQNKEVTLKAFIDEYKEIINKLNKQFL